MTQLTWAIIAIGATNVLIAQPGPPAGGGGNNAGDGIWRRNAFWGERQTFDSCSGHQPQTGDYHYHANPLFLRAQLNDNLVVVKNGRTGSTYAEASAPWTHSPILGWAPDGFPVYGPYAYTDAKSAASAVGRLKPSFRLRAISQRTSLPDWSLANHSGVSQQLSANQYGPDINVTFPLGRYTEDYEYVASLGDLDEYNGRVEVTPEFPQGIYCYHVTVDDSGTPAFPYIFGGLFYGTASAGRAQAIPDGVQDYFNQSGGTSTAATGSAAVDSWSTKNAAQTARATTGFDPSAGGTTTWPTSVPAGVQTSGGVSTPTGADVQRVRFSNTSVYVNAAGLPSYVIGPWFESQMITGVCANFASNQNLQYQFPRVPAAAATKTATAGGAQGLWVNGVPIFNFLDGGSYKTSTGADSGGGIVGQTVVQISPASGENGPIAPGSLVSGFPLFGAVLATSTQTASSATWPTMLGTTSVTVKDAAGISRAALLSYASPTQVNFQVPPDTSAGAATVTYTIGSTTVASNAYVLPVYPHLFTTSTGKLISSTLRANDAANTTYVVFYGSGLAKSTDVKATVGGVTATVSYAGAQGVYSGLDQYNVIVPSSQVGKTDVSIVVTASGRPSNAGLADLR